MKRIKLNLIEKDDAALKTFAENHGVQVDAAPTVYTNLAPAKTDFDTLLGTYADRIADVVAKRTALEGAIVLLGQTRVEVENAMRSRASRVETIAGDDEAVIVNAGFESVNPNPGPVGALPAPQSLRVSISEMTGTLNVKWKPVKGAKSYVVECRTHGATPGAWQQVKLLTSSRFAATGLTPGQEYAFRVRALGAAGEGPWSDEGVKMAV